MIRDADDFVFALSTWVLQNDNAALSVDTEKALIHNCSDESIEALFNHITCRLGEGIANEAMVDRICKQAFNRPENSRSERPIYYGTPPAAHLGGES